MIEKLIKEYLGKHFIKVYDNKYITLFMNFKIDKNSSRENKNITESNLKIKFLILLIFEKVSLVKVINLGLLCSFKFNDFVTNIENFSIMRNYDYCFGFF